jgi:hypothetical protein
MVEEIKFRVMFDNNRGASVSKSETSYGGKDGLYELAVLGKTCDGTWRIDYTTNITDDVVGYLQWGEIEGLLRRIQALPKRNLDHALDSPL